MSTPDVQALNEAVASILDNAPGVLALTGRAAGADNVVPWSDPMVVTALPVLAYAFVQGERGPIEGSTSFVYQLTAAAREASVANDLVTAGIAALTYSAFVAAGVDAFVLTAEPRAAQTAADAGGSDPDVHRADYDVVIVA